MCSCRLLRRCLYKLLCQHPMLWVLGLLWLLGMLGLPWLLGTLGLQWLLGMLGLP